MKLIKTVRASGLPVKNVDDYIAKYNVMYDNTLKENNVIPNKFLTEEESSKIDGVLKERELELKKEYPIEEFWPLMTTKKAWTSAIKQYGPIIVTYDKDNKAISYVILDIPIDS